MTTTGTRIRSARLARGLSQAEVAHRAGLGEATIRRAETGRAVPSLGTLERIAAAMGISVVSFIAPDATSALADRPENGTSPTPTATTR